MLTGTSFPCRTGTGEVTFDAKFGSDLFMPGIAGAVIKFWFPIGLQGSFFSSLLITSVSAAFSGRPWSAEEPAPAHGQTV